jgi:putative redox protein
MARITAELTSGTRVLISSGRHSWRADEPSEAGGDDTGPSPYELLLGALAACTCITLQLYCRHKGIALKSVSASYEHSRIHAQDCEACDDPKRGFLDRVESHIRIAGTFDDAQRKRLAEVAQRCPVHKTLT